MPPDNVLPSPTKESRPKGELTGGRTARPGKRRDTALQTQQPAEPAAPPAEFLLPQAHSSNLAEVETEADTLRTMLTGQERERVRAVRAAEEAGKTLALVRAEATAASEQLLRMQHELEEERKVRAQESFTWTAGISSLKEELALAIEQARLSESTGSRQRRWYRGLLAVTMAMAVASTALFVQTRQNTPAALNTARQSDRSVPPQQRPLAHRKPEVAASLGGTQADSDEMNALKRLTTALEIFPNGSAPAILRAASQWLEASGAPPCVAETAPGQMSLLVGNGAEAPLKTALSRCADAVEKILYR